MPFFNVFAVFELVVAPFKGSNSPLRRGFRNWGAMDAAGGQVLLLSPSRLPSAPGRCILTHGHLHSRTFIPKMPGHGKEPGCLAAPTTAEPPRWSS